MKQLIHLWQRIPRPCRAILNLTFSLILVVILYVMFGSPAFSRKHEFRRAERANFVGPSTILFSGKVSNYDHDHLIIGETDEGVLSYIPNNSIYPTVNYFPKTGGITIVSAPKQLPGFDWGMHNLAVSLPVFLIDDHPEAVRAELEIHVEGVVEYTLNGNEISITLDQHFSAESFREGEGYFRFTFDRPFNEDLADDIFSSRTHIHHDADGYALESLAQAFTEHGTHAKGTISSAVVRLYAADGTLIVETEQVLYPRM